MHVKFRAQPPRLFAILCVLVSSVAATRANAQVMTFKAPGKFLSRVEIRGYPSDSSCLNVYTVPTIPTNVKLLVTDYSLDSYGSPSPLPYQYICSGTPTCSVARSAYMTAPVGTMVVQSLTTGIALVAGETLSVCNYAGIGRPPSWTLRGFLYEGP